MLTHPPVHPRTGRPKDAVKRNAIIKAARDLFACQTFEAVTMEAVAAQANVSKMTVYSHFVDKETLLEHVVVSISDQMIAALAEPASGTGALRERLIAMGRVFLGIVLGPEGATMANSLPALLRGNPDLARRFYNAGPGRTKAALVAMIADAHRQGELAIDRADWVADDLLGLWDSGKPLRLMLGPGAAVPPDEIERRATRAVDVFLRAYQVGAPSAFAGLP